MVDSVAERARPRRSGPEPADALAREVARDLTATPKRLPCKYLYDALGSRLFEAICELPWYEITRAERRLLVRHADAIAAALGDPAAVVELGSGSGAKLSLVLGALERQGRPARVHLIDISRTALDLAGRTLSRFDGVTLCLHESSYHDGLRAVAADRLQGTHTLVLFLGSNIGNLSPVHALRFLRVIRSSLGPRDWLLLGADLVKPEADLLLAYDDPLGVTAAFNKNLLIRLNRELRADFDLRRFAHRAVWNADARRVECHLVSLCDQHVQLRAAGCSVRFRPGESIWTESSYKYEPPALVDLGARARFRPRHQWIDEPARFALTLFEAV